MEKYQDNIYGELDHKDFLLNQNLWLLSTLKESMASPIYPNCFKVTLSNDFNNHTLFVDRKCLIDATEKHIKELEDDIATIQRKITYIENILKEEE